MLKECVDNRDDVRTNSRTGEVIKPGECINAYKLNRCSVILNMEEKLIIIIMIVIVIIIIVIITFTHFNSINFFHRPNIINFSSLTIFLT